MILFSTRALDSIRILDVDKIQKPITRNTSAYYCVKYSIVTCNPLIGNNIDTRKQQ